LQRFLGQQRDLSQTLHPFCQNLLGKKIHHRWFNK
jgi:hypothetical protein